MLGAIAGDVIGSVFESRGQKQYDFPLFSSSSRFTDDTVLTIAIAKALLEQRDFQETIVELCRRYPHAGYGRSFEQWLNHPETGAYQSWGNGAAMRISPIGFAASNEPQCLHQAQQAVEMTHDHAEGIRGAQATAMSILLARQGADKEAIRTIIGQRFGYDLKRTVAAIRPHYRFDVSCQRSVPESIICFLDAEDYEGTIRNAVSLGGDTDTMACIAGGIAQAYWKTLPPDIVSATRSRLPDEFLDIIDRFAAAYPA